MKAAAAVLVSVVALMPSPAQLAAGVSCHIHPPGSAQSDEREIIGPFVDIRDCERERSVRFGPGGRCHCSAPFTPQWRLYEPGNVPRTRPLM